MKLRRKLLAAGFAFGATALTLTTSTFAWYTANNEVSIESINGATAAATDTSLFVAAATSYASVDANISASAPGARVASQTVWSTNVKPVLINEANVPSTVAASARRVLSPVAYTGDNTYQSFSTVTAVYSEATPKPTEDNFAEGEYYTKSEGENPTYTKATSYDSTVTKYYVHDHDKANYEKDTTSKYVYEYVLRFQKPNASTATDVYVSSFNLTNTAVASDSQQTALADNTTLASDPNVGIANVGTYNVDMLHALKMTVAVTNLTATGSYETTPTVASTTVYDLDGFADTSKDANLDTTANALEYYNTVLGRKLANEDTSYLNGAKPIKVTAEGSANATTSKLFTIPSTGFVEVRFTFWLDGWDSFCYDVCQNQNFAVDMSFTTENTKSVLTTHTVTTGKTA